MKTRFLDPDRRGAGLMARATRLWVNMVGVIALFAANPVMAQAKLDTIAGGPSQSSPPFWGFVNGNTAVAAQFHTPWALAMDAAGTVLYVADRDNNVVRKLNLLADTTSTFAQNHTNKLNQPVGVVTDAAGSVYVLNRGNGNNGSVLKFSASGGFLSTNATSLTNATAIAIDRITNLFVTVKGNAIIRISPSQTVSTVATLTNVGAQLQGIAVLDDGTLAVSDAGAHVIWVVDPFTGVSWKLAGRINQPGDTFGPGDEAQFRQPAGLSKAGDGYLVVADRGNHRVKVVDTWYGDVYKLYGVSSGLWYTAGPYPGWYDGVGGDELGQAGEVSALEAEALGSEEAREPVGVVVAPDGDVYTTEVYYHLIRSVSDAGLAAPGGPGVAPQFNAVMGLALNTAGSQLYAADPLNNAVYRLNFADNSTVTLTLTNLNKPVAVAVDGSDNFYVLNQATGVNGYIQKYTKFGNWLTNAATGLNQPTAFDLDGSGNLLVAELGGKVKRIPAGGGSATVVATVTNAGVQLRGLVVQDYGGIAISDAGNHAVYVIDPITSALTRLTGGHGAGDTIGTADFAQFNQPLQLAKAGIGFLVVADSLNNRVMVVDSVGTATNLVSTNSLVWFGRSGDPVAADSSRYVPMAYPAGIVVAPNGDVLTGELLFHNLRRTLTTGLPGPGKTSPDETGTNVVVTPPNISPSSGYFPMGQIITIGSPRPDVFYTTDGTEPTTNSLRVTMNGNAGTIRWSESMRDLTWLRVRTFDGTNASAVTQGRPVMASEIGVPTGIAPNIYAGVGSTIVIPVVANLRTNDRVRTLQFRLEVAPDVGAPDYVSDQLRPLSVLSNDFIAVVTAAQGKTAAVYSASSYPLSVVGTQTNWGGLAISAIGTNSNVIFSNYAVVALLAVPIPPTARQGQTYTVTVKNASATSDGLQAPVALTQMPNVTILVTNVAYTVGDSSPGTWYNAGGFGNRDLDNADVNNVFYASLGIRVPYSFTDAYNAMDVYPKDTAIGVGGDDLILYLDWQVVRQRSLRLDTNNWMRVWTDAGELGGTRTNLVPQFAPPPRPEMSAAVGTWYRQALVGAVSVGNVKAYDEVDVPVYVKTAEGCPLKGLQFRVSVTPEGTTPGLTSPPQFIAAAGVTPPDAVVNLVDELGLGWSLNTVDFASHSSNLLGYVRFTVPAYSGVGKSFLIQFSHADGSPDLATEYNFETRSAQVKVLGAATPATICSEEWKARYFNGNGDPAAADAADGDQDGARNWEEFLAGTDPTDRASFLAVQSAETLKSNNQSQFVVRWQTAPGRLYEVLRSDSPASGWTVRQTVSGDGSEREYVETENLATPHFYRLRVVP